MTSGFYQQTNLAGPDPFGLERAALLHASAGTRELKILPGLSAEFRGSTTTGLVFNNNGATPTATPLAPLAGGTTSKAEAISDTGLIAGQADHGHPDRPFATLWRGQVATNLGGLPGSTRDGALDVNDNGARSLSAHSFAP